MQRRAGSAHLTEANREGDAFAGFDAARGERGMIATALTGGGDLAQRILSGDRGALGELFDCDASRALVAASRMVADQKQAQDVLHDAFVVAWRTIGQFDPSRGSLQSWVMSIVRAQAIARASAQHR